MPGNELQLQQYLTRNRGENLRKIDSELEFLEAEYKFESGRIDIVAKKESTPIGIELKATNYQTRAICAQLMNYLNYISKFDGNIYFIAPKIKYGIYSTLKTYYDTGLLKFFEVTKKNDLYSFKEIKLQDIDDKKRVETIHCAESRTLENKLFEEKMKKSVDILIHNKKKAGFVKNIIDNNKDKTKYYEDIVESVIDIVEHSTKTRGLGALYRLLKLF